MKRKEPNPNTKRFSKSDMMRFARYLLNGSKSESELSGHWHHWFHGPQ